jgi:hypothetical protein
VAYTLAKRLSYFRNAVLTTINAAVQVKVKPMPFAIYSIASEGFGTRHGNLRSDGVGPEYGTVGPVGPVDEGPNCQAIIRKKPYTAMFHGFFIAGGLALVAPRNPATRTQNVIPGRMGVDDRPYLALFDVKMRCASSYKGATCIRPTIGRLTTPHSDEM